MSVEIWLSYVTTVLVLMSTPGPSHLLMLSNSMAHGFRPSLATAAGDLSANFLQILAAGFGLAGIVLASEAAFVAVKWAGVAYLVWLGVAKFRARPRIMADAARGAAASHRALFSQGFVTSATNPKAVIFFAALFPLFLNPERDLATQIALLGATYIVLDFTFLAAYGGSASWIAGHVRSDKSAWTNRVSGVLLIAAAILLGLKGVGPR